MRRRRHPFSHLILVAGTFPALAGVYVYTFSMEPARPCTKCADSWHGSNRIIAWLLHQVDAIIQFLAGHEHNSPASDLLPSPTATHAS